MKKLLLVFVLTILVACSSSQNDSKSESPFGGSAPAGTGDVVGWKAKMSARDYFNQALRFGVEGKYEEAIESYREVIKLDSEYLAGSYSGIGYILLDQFEDLDGARVAFEKALELNPKDYEPHYRLSFIYKEKGNLERSIYHLRIYIENWRGEDFFLEELQDELELLETGSVSPKEIGKIIGYVDSGQFHPLIVLEDKNIKPARSTRLDLTGRLLDAFEKEGHTVVSEKQMTDIDVFTDEEVRFGIIGPDIREKDRFYILENPSLHEEVILEKDDAIKNFYEHFAFDDWGRHFIEDQSWLKLPLDQLYEKSEVWTHYVTDLDDDGFLELWMTYRLMWGELGRMIYEQSEGDQPWASIIIHCYNCD